jgi:hypothetical protein
MIRIRQPAANFWGDDQFSLAAFEIYGSAIYDPISSNSPKRPNLGVIRQFAPDVGAV